MAELTESEKLIRASRGKCLCRSLAEQEGCLKYRKSAPYPHEPEGQCTFISRFDGTSCLHAEGLKDA